ncbi:MAG: right-handed parallel beta-helix repeat-containing protein, partial [Chloroflexota bacterium]
MTALNNWNNLWRQLTNRKRSSPQTGGQRRSRWNRARLRLEPLEDRCVPASFFVSTAGSDANAGTAALPFRTIQKGVDQAALSLDGLDFVNVAGGIYDVAGVDLGINIPPNVNLSQLHLEGGWDAAFTAQNPAATPTVFLPQQAASVATADVLINDSDVTIQGFTFVFDGMPGAGGARQGGGVRSQQQNAVFGANGAGTFGNLVECGSSSTATAHDNYGYRTAGFNATGLLIQGNTFTASASFASGAIYLNPAAIAGGETVANNVVNGSNLTTGIVADTLPNVTISGNDVSRTGPADADNFALIQGGVITGTSDQTALVISGNTVDGGAGISNSIGISLSGTAANVSTGAMVTNNNVANGSNIGIYMTDGVSSPTVSGGAVTGNGRGIVAVGSVVN